MNVGWIQRCWKLGVWMWVLGGSTLAWSARTHFDETPFFVAREGLGKRRLILVKKLQRRVHHASRLRCGPQFRAKRLSHLRSRCLWRGAHLFCLVEQNFVCVSRNIRKGDLERRARLSKQQHRSWERKNQDDQGRYRVFRPDDRDSGVSFRRYKHASKTRRPSNWRKNKRNSKQRQTFGGPGYPLSRKRISWLSRRGSSKALRLSQRERSSQKVHRGCTDRFWVYGLGRHGSLRVSKRRARIHARKEARKRCDRRRVVWMTAWQYRCRRRSGRRACATRGQIRCCP
ncbi:MAG: hypothetical protein AAGJ35_07815 [Myxococcota bacterium]